MNVIYTITYERYSFRYRIWCDGMLRNFSVNSKEYRTRQTSYNV